MSILQLRRVTILIMTVIITKRQSEGEMCNMYDHTYRVI